MKKANRLLAIFYTILLTIVLGMDSALLSTTHSITINDHLLNLPVILGAVLVADLLFFFLNPLFLRSSKDILNGAYSASSEQQMDALIRYPFRVIPLTVVTEATGIVVYLIAGTATRILETKGVLSLLPGLAVTFLFILIVSISSQIYVFKIVTNTYISKAVRKMNIIELKSIRIPIKYKLIGIYTIISIGAFIIIAYAVINNANLYMKQNLYENSMNSALTIAHTINNNPDADDILKTIEARFKGHYRWYLYNPANHTVRTYSSAGLGATVVTELAGKTVINDPQNGQTLYSLHQPVTVDGVTCFVVVGISNEVYRSILRGFISNISLTGVFILFIVMITTFLISSDIVSHEQRLAEYSAALSAKELSKIPAVVSTDEAGLIVLNLRQLIGSFKESRTRTHDNITAMNEVMSSTFKNIGRVKTTITEQAAYTDKLFGIINSIREVSRQITGLGMPLDGKVNASSEQVAHAVQINREIKSSLTGATSQIARTLRTVEKDITLYEDLRRTIMKLKNILASFDSASASIQAGTSGADKALMEFSAIITGIIGDNGNGMEFTKDIDVIMTETQNIAEGVLSFLTTFLSHIQQADEMLGIINNVAERTNLLSVNAFILASSPQTEGKNFRVVAEEIKRLAARARTGSKDISDYITRVRRNVDDTILGIKNINNLIITLRQFTASMNAIQVKTEALAQSVLDMIGNILRDNEAAIAQTQDGDTAGGKGFLQRIDHLAESAAAAINGMQGIATIFGEIKSTFAREIEMSSSHDTILLSINNALENIKTFIASINDSLAIEIKEQIAFSSDSAKSLIDHIKNNEQHIMDLDTIMNQLVQELDLLKENVNLFTI